MIYFIHDQTSRAIKIGCARDPRQRLSTLQTSTSNRLVLLGTTAGAENKGARWGYSTAPLECNEHCEMTCCAKSILI